MIAPTFTLRFNIEKYAVKQGVFRCKPKCCFIMRTMQKNKTMVIYTDQGFSTLLTGHCNGGGNHVVYVKLFPLAKTL